MVSRKNYKIAKQVQKVNSERKYYQLFYIQDMTDGGTATPPTGFTTIRDLTGFPIQGTGRQQRIGNRITLSSIHIKYSVYYPAENTTWNNIDASLAARVIIFQWFDEASGAHTPVMNEILDFSAQMGTGNFVDRQIQVLCPYNKNYSTQFKILYDKIHTIRLNPVYDYLAGTDTWKSTMLSGDDVNQITIYKFTGEVSYITPNAANDGDNHVFMAVLSDSSAAPHPRIEASIRVSYYDS